MKDLPALAYSALDMSESSVSPACEAGKGPPRSGARRCISRAGTMTAPGDKPSAHTLACLLDKLVLDNSLTSKEADGFLRAKLAKPAYCMAEQVTQTTDTNSRRTSSPQHRCQRSTTDGHRLLTLDADYDRAHLVHSWRRASVGSCERLRPYLLADARRDQQRPGGPPSRITSSSCHRWRCSMTRLAGVFHDHE